MNYQLFCRFRNTRKQTWYAWYMGNGKRKWRSTGQKLKRDAEEIIDQWQEEDKHKAAGTLRGFAADFFIPGKCPYLDWKAEQGGLKAHTIYEHRKNLTKYILPKFGDYLLPDIGPVIVEKWLKVLSVSGSLKNSIINTFNIVLTEAKRAKLIKELPGFRRFARRSRKCDTLTIDEIHSLFPDDDIDIALNWALTPKDITGYMFGLMFRLILHAGMRPGEGRAVDVSQIYPEYNGVLIDRQIDSDRIIALPKKGTPEDRRERLVIVPSTTMEKLVQWMETQEIIEGCIFKFNGRPITKEHLEDRFRVGLKNTNIIIGKRKLVPYSLRFTFRSRVQGLIDAETIRTMMGHRSIDMSDHYLQVSPEQFEAYRLYNDRINRAWE